MLILALDPGSIETAYMIYDAASGKPVKFGKVQNEKMRMMCCYIDSIIEEVEAVAIEMIASYGMPVGKEVFETCVWIGRFIEALGGGESIQLVYRKDIKLHLCGSVKAKDGNVRQALIDRFGPPGTKKTPGVTYGISKDVWSALAVAVYHADNLKTNERKIGRAHV